MVVTVLVEVTLIIVLEVTVVVVVIAEVVVIIGVKALLGAGEVIDTLFVVMVIDVLINVVNAVEITLEFAVSVPCSVGALSDEVVDLLMNALAVVGLPDIDVDVLVDVNVNVFAGVITVKFVMTAPL